MWSRPSWLRELGAGIEARRLAYESEVFLSGQYAQVLQTDGHAVPPWAWLNALAHGSQGLLIELAERRRYAEANSDDERWNQVVGGLAAELLAIASWTGRRVDELQRAALVRLEAGPDLVGDGSGCSPHTFEHLVRQALAPFRDAAG